MPISLTDAYHEPCSIPIRGHAITKTIYLADDPLIDEIPVPSGTENFLIHFCDL